MTATYANQSTVVGSIQLAPSTIASNLSSLISTQYGDINTISSLLSTQSNFFATQTFGPQYSTIARDISNTLFNVSSSIYEQTIYYSTLSSYTASNTIPASQISSFAANDLIPPGYRPTKEFLILSDTAPGRYLLIPDISAISTTQTGLLTIEEIGGFSSRQDIIGTTDQILAFGRDNLTNLTLFDAITLAPTASYYAPIGSNGIYRAGIYHPRYHYVLIGTNSAFPTQTLTQFVETDPYRISLFNVGQYIPDTRAIAQSPAGDIIVGGTASGISVLGYNPSTDPDLIFETFSFYSSDTTLPPNGITALDCSGYWIAGGRGTPDKIISYMSDISGRNLNRWARADISQVPQDLSAVSYLISDIARAGGKWIAASTGSHPEANGSLPLLIYESSNSITWTVRRTTLSGEDLFGPTPDPTKLHLYAASNGIIYLQTQTSLYQASISALTTWRLAIPRTTQRFNSLLGAYIPANTIEYNTLYLKKQIELNDTLYMTTSSILAISTATRDNISSLSTQLARGLDVISQDTLSTLSTALGYVSEYRIQTESSFTTTYTTQTDISSLTTQYNTEINPSFSSLSSYFSTSVKAADLSTLSTLFAGRTDPQTTTAELLSTTAGIYAYPVYSTLTAPQVQAQRLNIGLQDISDQTALTVQLGAGGRFYINSNVDPNATTMSYAGGITTMNTNFVVDGYLSKVAGTFNIEHPNPDAAAAGYRLRHSFVEAPTRGENIYRYVVSVHDGRGSVELPSYFESLNENPQVWVQPATFAQARAKICGRFLTVFASEDCEVSVMVIGTRADPAARKGFDDRGGVYFSR
jgi:hypothetical protein